MATRQTRPRTIDVNKQLVIIRDVTELDSLDGLPNVEGLKPPVQEGAAAAAAQESGGSGTPAPEGGAAAAGAAPAAVTAPTPAPSAILPPLVPHGPKKPKHKEIPVPEIRSVATYTREYLPTFKIPETYIRGKGGVGYKDDEVVEYDLDNEDEDWLEAFNRGNDHRLSDTKFERMLWKLELAWNEALEATISVSERGNASALISISCLPKVQGLAVLKKTVGGRDAICETVYDYWASKRKRWQKPIMRRLQAPTPASDTNPFNVFRPREKPNRPLTRRRRENSIECIEKMRALRENILRALEMAELMLIRERKKRDVTQVDMTVQRCQLNLHHQASKFHDAIRTAAAQHLAELKARSIQDDPRITAYAEANSVMPGLATGADLHIRQSLARKRRRVELEVILGGAVTNADPMTRLPPPLPLPDAEPLWAFQCDLTAVLGPTYGGAIQEPPKPSDAWVTPAGRPKNTQSRLAQLPPAAATALAAGRAYSYVGRGGRVVVARCDPLTREPLAIALEVAAAGTAANGGGAAGFGSGMLTPTSTRESGGGADGAPGSGGGAVTSGPQPMQVEVDMLAFPWQQRHAEPWAATLDLSLLPDYIDKAPFLEQRRLCLHLQDYHEQLAAAASNIQAAQAAQEAAKSAAGGVPGTPMPAAAVAVPPPPIRPAPVAPFSRKVLRVLPAPVPVAVIANGTPAGKRLQ